MVTLDHILESPKTEDKPTKLDPRVPNLMTIPANLFPKDYKPTYRSNDESLSSDSSS